MCAHTIAVAESVNCLQQFLEALQKSKPECSVTKLVTTSNARRKAGTKSGAPRKRGSELHKAPVTAYRSRLDDVCFSDLDTGTETSVRATTPTVGTCTTSGYGQRSSIVANESISGDVSVGCTSQTFYSSCVPQYRSDYPYFPSPPLYGSNFLHPSSTMSYGEMYGYDYSPYATQYQSPPQMLTSPPGFTNPFIVKFLNNRIKKCRGCNQEFSRKVDGSPPDPPLNLV